MTIEELQQKYNDKMEALKNEFMEELDKIKNQDDDLRLFMPNDNHIFYIGKFSFAVEYEYGTTYSKESSFLFESEDQAIFIRDIIKPIVLLWKIQEKMYGERWIPGKHADYYAIIDGEVMDCASRFRQVMPSHVPFETQEDAERAKRKLDQLMGDK